MAACRHVCRPADSVLLQPRGMHVKAWHQRPGQEGPPAIEMRAILS